MKWSNPEIGLQVLYRSGDVRANSASGETSAIRSYAPLAGRPRKTEKLSGKGKYRLWRHKHMGLPLHLVIQWFKTMTTNDYINRVKSLAWEPFMDKIWQRNYYEHIIRNDESYRRIANYIVHNPQNWQEDEYFPARD